METKDIFDEIICYYQEEYEKDKSIPWVKDNEELHQKITKTTTVLDETMRDGMYNAQNLGFIQGMRCALDLMNLTNKGENKPVIEKFIKSIENRVGEFQNDKDEFAFEDVSKRKERGTVQNIGTCQHALKILQNSEKEPFYKDVFKRTFELLEEYKQQMIIESHNEKWWR